MTPAIRVAVILVSTVVWVAAPALAQTDPPAAPAGTAAASAAQDKDKATAASTDFETGELNFQVTGRPDVASSKFQEYRDVVNGVSLPSFRLFGSENGVRFDLRGQNVKQLDERYTGYLETDLFAVSADYNSIVHRIGNGGRTLLVQQSPGVWRMSPTLQQAFQNIWESTANANRLFTTFVAPLFTPSIFAGNTVDVTVQRERTDIVVDIAPNQPFSAKMNYRREQRHGSGGLSSNYISYEIETPSVTEYLTQDVGFDGSLVRPWGSVHAGLHYNWFIDQVPSLVFDNPFRATDALSATVGTGAAATGVGGPAGGRMINPPNNSAYLSAIGTTLKLAHHTRITADVNLGRLSQNDQFFPFMTNTAVVRPVLAAQTSSLPAQSLNGKMNTTSVVLAITSRPTEPLHLALRFRRYDLDNQTPRITFPGYASWDRTWNVGPRINVPYGYTNSRLDASADYDVGKLVTLEGAYRRTTIDRTFRETEQTVENSVNAALIVHVADMANLRAMYERGSRDYSGLDLGRSEGASFGVAPAGPSANALGRDGSLRFDQSRRDSDRAGIIFDISPGSVTSFAFTYLHNKDTYNDTVYGLQNASYDTYTGEVTLTPSDLWNVSAYYTREKNGSAQVNNGTNNFPAIDNFTTLLNDTVDTAGASAVIKLVPAATLNLGGRYQNLVGTAGFTTQANSSYQLARASLGGVQDIPNADNAKIVRLDASVDWNLRPKVTLTLGAWYEDYKFSDVDSVGLQNIYPGAFFLALNDGSYTATVGYVRLTYRW
jgi:MtrB/PioB family decaheme-associated outer membrane protein